jgi:hypothetical protein
VDDDITDCTTLDEMTGLRDSLEQLSKEFGLDFTRHIQRLDAEISLREDDDDRYSGETGVSTRSVEILVENQVTDEDIRQMFSTLDDSGLA